MKWATTITVNKQTGWGSLRELRKTHVRSDRWIISRSGSHLTNKARMKTR